MNTEKVGETGLIGERIKHLRMALCLTQEQFAKAIHKSSSYVGHLESGRIKPKKSALSDMCAAFGVRIGWLETGEGQICPDGKLPAAQKKNNAIEGEHLRERVKAIRKEAKLTQAHMGEQLGVSAFHIKAIEMGRVIPSASLLRYMAETYNVSLPWLLTGQGAMDDQICKEKDEDIAMIEYLASHEKARRLITIAMGQDDQIWDRIEKLLTDSE